MNLVVDQLSEFEDAAQKVMEQTNLQKKELFAEMEEQMKAFDRQVDIEAAAKLDQLREKLKNEQEDNLLALKHATERAVETMESEYNNNHSKIAQKLLSHLIKE
ncbi:MAG TPA: DUF2240 family protein [Candidatus Merdenecus merdavium]|nr:DUF2240 family protein [Candidatus Merdenecus merdavium]